MSDLELRVENLNVGFGRRTVLRDISFTVHSGEFICLLGQNAAGKTTLFKAVSNLIASSGRVTLCENGKALPRSAIAYLPQLTQVQSRLTVFEMVMLGLGRRLSWRVTPDIFERVDQTLHAMQISHLADRPVASLSGGQKQLVFMAQAFVSRPRVLLLDEPTSALDLRHQLIVMQAARSYAKTTGAAVLAIVHDLMLAARFSDKLLMLGDGTIRRFAAPAEVLTPEELAVVYRVEAAVERSQEGLLTVIPMTPLDVDDGTHGHGSHPHAHDPACTHSSSSDQHDHRIRHDDKVSGYWNTRAEGYSLRTADELNGPRGAHWRERLLSNLRGVPHGGSVLDVGCGPALLAITAARCGWKAYGCDSSPEMLRHALENAKTAGADVTFCQCDAAALPFADETFDAVISRNVLWNLPHPERALKEWMRVLKPGGRLLYEDGNHYRHLVDPLFKHHHDNMPAPFGHQPQYMLNVDTSAIDAIAQTLPLTQELRPQWDLQALIDLGFTETQVIEPSLAEVSDPLSGKSIRIVTDFVAAATKPAAAAFSNVTAAT